MAIYKKIKGEDTRVASNGIIDHSQLSGRDGYGAHPISAIRRLPEKLTEHKKAIQDQKDALDQEIIDRKAAVQLEQEARENADTSIINNTKRITLQEGENGTLIFTDYENNKVTVQGGYLPDDETIELQERYSQVTLDESSFVANKYYIFNNGEYILAQSYDPEATYYQVQDKMVAVGLNTGSNIISGQALSNDLTSIKSIINAKGGYLDSYNFGTASPSQEDLTQYAIQDIGDIETASEIWDKTRVINLFTSKQHPNQDTWVWDLNSLTWSNLGNISLISDANNSGLHGLVTGSQEDYEGFIDINGQIKVNGLPELSSKVDNLIVNSYNSTQDHTYSSKYSNEHFAPLSFVSRLYFDKVSATEVSLIDEQPEGTNNYLSITSNNDSFDWNNSNFTITRKLRAETTLNEETSFTVDINFEAQQNCKVAFGARIKVSEDNGSTWTTISSNQQYGQEEYSANTLSSTKFIVYTDLLTTNSTYEINTLLQIEVFIKGEDTSSITNYIACGYELDGSVIYSYLQFNYQNVMINTDQIADNAVTYNKLSSNLQTSINTIATKQDTLVSGSNIKTINGNSILGSGNYNIETYHTFPITWTTDGTIAELMEDIEADASAIPGMVYLGEITCSDMPFIGNGDLVVEIIDGNSTNKVIVASLNSGNISPYYWRYTYWITGGTVHTSGWISFQPALNSAQLEAVNSGVTSETVAKVTTNKNEIDALKDSKQDDIIEFSNVEVQSWVSDNTYADFPYKADISLTGVVQTMIPIVTFRIVDALSGNYAPIAETGNNKVTIWGKTNTSIIIDTILCIPIGSDDTQYIVNTNSAGGYTYSITSGDYTIESNLAGGNTVTIGGNN